MFYLFFIILWLIKTTKMKKILLISIAIILALISCEKDDNSDNSETQVIEKNYTELGIGKLRGDGSEGITESNKIIDNEADWKTLITQMNTTTNMGEDFNEMIIDFDKSIIIAIFSDNYLSYVGIEITEVTKNDSSIQISTKITNSIAPALSQPFCILKMPITDKSITFNNIGRTH